MPQSKETLTGICNVLSDLFTCCTMLIHVGQDACDASHVPCPCWVPLAEWCWLVLGAAGWGQVCWLAIGGLVKGCHDFTIWIEFWPLDSEATKNPNHGLVWKFGTPWCPKIQWSIIMSYSSFKLWFALICELYHARSYPMIKHTHDTSELWRPQAPPTAARAFFTFSSSCDKNGRMEGLERTWNHKFNDGATRLKYLKSQPDLCKSKAAVTLAWQ